MNYYEELGVAQDASAEEIRAAYKTLARVLHPDAQADEHLKPAAERQMKRLNEIVATLGDPAKRRMYDQSLRQPAVAMLPPPPEEPAWKLFAVRNWFWILLSGMLLGSAVWYVAEGAPEPVPGTAVETAKEPGSVVSALMDRVLQRRAAPEKTQGARAPKPFQVPEARAGADTAAAVVLPEPPALQQGVGAASGVPALGVNPAAPPPPKAQGAGRTASFAGNWLYSGEDNTAQDAKAYRAFYIELSLEEENGRLKGNYRARYHVPDRAISPEVAMRMEGEAKAGRSGRLTWASGEGAKGVAELTLRGRDTLYMTWWTTEFGRRAGLVSGTAQLVRQAVR